MNVVGDSWEGT